jgi:monofunctional biosynthetic peptidoglycan transglycosylase
VAGRRRASRWRWPARVVALALALPVASVAALRFVPPATSAFMLQARLHALARGEPLEVRYEWVPWSEIAPPMRLAVVAAEDQRFPTHWGFDFHAIADAIEANPGRARPRGASTISQQVAKNLFLSQHASWLRKGLEAGFTLLLELLWPKRRILEVYLNVAEFGRGVYGVEAAAQRFFGKPARALAPGEAALLAAVLPSPRRRRADQPAPGVRARAARIEREMARLGAGHLAGL